MTIDAHQLAARVHERAARVAGVNGRIGLDEILVSDTPRFVRPTADTMPRDGLVQLIRLPTASAIRQP